MLKKIMFMALGLGVAGSSFAGSMGPLCSSNPINTPCVSQQFELGVEALYFRSSYGAEKGYPLITNAGSTLINSSNDWNWGYRLVGAYHFNSGNDISLNWMHFNTSSSISGITFPLTTTVNVPSNLNDQNRLDQVNLVMGQYLNLGARNAMRFYGGMQYADIQSTAQTYLANTVVEPIYNSPVNVFDNTNYKGYGPSFGIDYTYQIFHGLSLTANGSGSILYGTTRYHEGLVLSNFNLIEKQVYASRKAIVPSLEAKLGLNYAYIMTQGIINIDAGYEALNYFSPLNAQTLQNLGAKISSVNYGLYGPYFGLKYIANP